VKRRAFLALLPAVAANVFATTGVPANTPERRFLAGNRFFHLPEPSASGSAAVRFITFGDAGTGDDAQNNLATVMAAHHRERPFDTVLLLGDNIYPDGNLAEVAAKFERPYAELLKRGVKFQAVLGNHDIRKGGDTQVNYPDFNMGGRAYYSFSRGGDLVEFFALDSNDFDQKQKQWLEGALTASKARWKIAYFHHPIYSSGKRHGSDLRLRAELEPLFVRYGVAAAFSGHDHTYERAKLQQGVQYFVSGAGGKLRRGDLNRQSSIFASGSDESSCFMSVEITPDRFKFNTINAVGQVVDQGEFEPRVAVRSAGSGM
jgi:calcineurin-like phosphoesterase family protein